MFDKKKLALALLVIFALNIIIIMLVQGMSLSPEPSRRVATGSVISQIQPRSATSAGWKLR